MRPRQACGDSVFQPLDLGLDLVLAGTLEEPLEHGVRVEQAEIDPEQPVQSGELQVLERLGRGAGAELFGGPHLLGDLSQRQTTIAQTFEAAQQGRRQRPENPVEGLGHDHGSLLPHRLVLLDIYVPLKLRVRAEHSQVGGLARQHQRHENVRVTRYQCESQAAQEG